MAQWNKDSERNIDQRNNNPQRDRDIPINNKESDYDDRRSRQPRLADTETDYPRNETDRRTERDRGRRNYSLPLDRSAFDVHPVSPDPYMTGGRRFYYGDEPNYSPDYLDKGADRNFSPSQYRPGTYDPTGYDEEYHRYEAIDQDYGQLSRYDRPLTNRVPDETYRQQQSQSQPVTGQSKLLVRDVMTRDVTTVTRETKLREAADLMKDEDVGSLPVVESGKVIGIVTDRDIVVRGLAEDADLSTKTVGEIMSTNISMCRNNDRAVDVLRLMGEHQVRRLPVVDNDNRLRGIITLGDIAVETERDHELALALSRISKPGGWQR